MAAIAFTCGLGGEESTATATNANFRLSSLVHAVRPNDRQVVCA
jgi:hypothetical protein